MRFSQARADAFARYTLTGLLNHEIKKEGPEYILWMRRSELASVLGMMNSRHEHAQYVAERAATEGIVTGFLNDWIYFFYDASVSDFGVEVDISRATSITDAFENVHGSAAAEEMWERWDEEDISPDQPTKERKIKGRPSKKVAQES